MSENQQNTEEKESAKKEGWIKFSCGMTAVIAVSAALGYVAGFAATKLLSK